MKLQRYQRPFAGMVGVVIATILCPLSISGQQLGGPPTHYRHQATMTPGQIGRDALARRADFHGYFQPVEVAGPEGSQMSVRQEGAFVPGATGHVKAGLLIGHVYRFKITEIPNYPGFELYPTVELINRLYPPEGQVANFPIPVFFSQEEIEMALDGKFITRVVYLETPDMALPVRQAHGTQRVFDVGPTEDPLQAADALGRPMAILRLGSRIPTNDGIDSLDFGSPPLQILED